MARPRWGRGTGHSAQSRRAKAPRFSVTSIRPFGTESHGPGSGRSATISAWNGGATSTAGCCASCGHREEARERGEDDGLQRESLVWRRVSYLWGCVVDACPAFQIENRVRVNFSSAY